MASARATPNGSPPCSTADTIRAVLREAVEHAGIADAGTALAGQVTVRRGTTPAASR